MWQIIEDPYKVPSWDNIWKFQWWESHANQQHTPNVIATWPGQGRSCTGQRRGNLTFRTISILEILLSAPVEEPAFYLTCFLWFFKNCSSASLDGDHKFLFLKWVLWSQPAGTRSILLVFTVQMLSPGCHQLLQRNTETPFCLSRLFKCTLF